MAKKNKIKTTAAISPKNGIQLSSQQDNIVFNKFHVEDGDMGFLRDIIDEKSLVSVSLIYPGPADDKFPPITCECGMKNYKLGKDADIPMFVNMKFSDNQIIQLRNIQKAEEEMTIEITRLQGAFDFEAKEADEE